MEVNNYTQEAYLYDAFISYRHLPLDMAVASKLQELLESYRPPKNAEGLAVDRISRIFRDESELPTSGDLGNDIREALRSSRYLIVVCSEHTKESKWCMEEIRLFKEFHKGRTDNILTLLVSGDPENVFPDALLSETRVQISDEGEAVEYEEAIEPLCGDVRAETVRKSLKLLKTEFLRVAAPLFGCSFDTLYQRHLRRQRKRNITMVSSSVGLLAAILLTVSVFAYKTWISENQFKKALAENYMRQGSEYAVNNSPQEALMYFYEAMSISPDDVSSASVGASLLLQEYCWPVYEEELSGDIIDGEYVSKNYISSSKIENFYLFTGIEKGIKVFDDLDNLIKEIPVDENHYASYLGNSAGQWAFKLQSLYDSSDFILCLYDPVSDVYRTVPKPDDYSKYYDPDNAMFDSYYIAAIDKKRAVVTGGGLVRLIAFDGDGNYETVSTADLADAFTLTDKTRSVSTNNMVWVSDDCSYIAVKELNNLAIYSTDSLFQSGAIPSKYYGLLNVDFNSENEIAVAYGNPYSLSGGLLNPGGYFSVFDVRGDIIYEAELDEENAVTGVNFSKNNENLLLYWSQNKASIFDLEQQKEISAPIYTDNILSACFYDDSSVCVSSAVYNLDEEIEIVDKTIRYSYVEIPDYGVELKPGEGVIDSFISSDKRTVFGTEGKSLVTDGQTLSMYDKEGSLLASQKYPMTIISSLVAVTDDLSTVFVGDSNFYSGLLMAEVDFENNTIGDFMAVDNGGNKVLNIWTVGNNIAIEGSSREIMIFNKMGEKVFSATPENNYLPATIISDPDFRYIAIALEETVTQENEIGYTKNSYVEVWDAAYQLPVAVYRIPEKELDVLTLTKEGMLVWGTNRDTCCRLIPDSAPDYSALEYMKNLCSLELNDRQEAVKKNPSLNDISKDSWYSALGNWTEASFTAEKTEYSNELSAEISALVEADDIGTVEWINRCDDLWKSLAEGEYEFSIEHIDLFFKGYYFHASMKGNIDSIGYGLQIYFDLSKDLSANSDELVESSLTTYVNSVLNETNKYDELVAKEYLALADINEKDLSRKDSEMENVTDETVKYMWEEVDRPMFIISTYYYEAWANALTDPASTEVWTKIVDFCTGYDYMYSTYGDSAAISFLLFGYPDKAVETTNKILDLMNLGMAEDDIEFYNLWLEEHLKSINILVSRGGISPQAANEYYKGINAKFGIEITAVDGNAQANGFLLGDLILEIDGKKIPSFADVKRLMTSDNDGAICTVERDGEFLSIPLTKGIECKYFCSLQ